jgi:hypothetical protein
VTAFLNYLARERCVAASTQNQALSALLFLYREVLAMPLPWLDELERVRRPAHVPTVLTRFYDDDLHARPEQGCGRRDEPAPSRRGLRICRS